MADISGFGSVVTIVASNTYPTGFPITQFSDDTDAFDSASIQIADAAMGLNGDLITWSKAAKIPVVISVIPNSTDDLALELLANNNRVGKGKSNAGDIITLTRILPDGSTITYTNGKITDAPFGSGISSAGRLKTKVYAFAFENKVGA